MKRNWIIKSIVGLILVILTLIVYAVVYMATGSKSRGEESMLPTFVLFFWIFRKRLYDYVKVRLLGGKSNRLNIRKPLLPILRLKEEQGQTNYPKLAMKFVLFLLVSFTIGLTVAFLLQEEKFYRLQEYGYKTEIHRSDFKSNRQDYHKQNELNIKSGFLVGCICFTLLFGYVLLKELRRENTYINIANDEADD